MPTGRPIATKCPRCRRGQHGHGPVVKGIERTDKTRRRSLRNTRRRGATVHIQRWVVCLDCGHGWWTTLESPRGLAALSGR